jgi:Lar family restriction alleviation protein
MTGVDPKGLQPCPFCGDRNIEAYGPQIICEHCGAGTMVHDKPSEAIEAWNRRALTPLKGEPVAWQWRHRSKRKDGWRDWSDWHAGRREPISTATYESEERPLFASQPLPETEEKALAREEILHAFFGAGKDIVKAGGGAPTRWDYLKLQDAWQAARDLLARGDAA